MLDGRPRSTRRLHQAAVALPRRAHPDNVAGTSPRRPGVIAAARRGHGQAPHWRGLHRRMGNALAMLCLRHDAAHRGPRRRCALPRRMRRWPYAASRTLRRAEPMLFRGKARQASDAPTGYLAPGTFASRSARAALQDGHPRSIGIRNSHPLSVAPTGTVSPAFADNARPTASGHRSRDVQARP